MQTTDSHKVTVVIPTYNCARYLPRAIDSAMNQTHPNIRVLVVDDGSEDNTHDVLSKYERIDNLSYILLSQPASGTASVGRNIGIMLGGGDYISFLDSDDSLMPDKIKIQLIRMEEDRQKMCNVPILLKDLFPLPTHAEIDACFSAMTVFRAGNPPKVSGELLNFFYAFNPNIVIPNMGDTIGTNLTTGLFSRNIFRKLGGFKEISVGEDSEFLERMLAFGYNISFIPTPLYNYYRENENSIMEKHKIKVKAYTKEERGNSDKRAVEHARRKKMMRTAKREEEFLQSFATEIDIDLSRILSIHNRQNLTLDDKVLMSETTRSSIKKALGSE